MTQNSSDPDTIHFTGSITIVIPAGVTGRGVVTRYGDELGVTPELRTENTDRVGGCFLDFVDDEEAQRVAWGSVRVRRGPWPPSVSRLAPGSDESRQALQRERLQAQAIDDPTERAARLREVFAFYDPQPPLSSVAASAPTNLAGSNRA